MQKKVTYRVVLFVLVTAVLFTALIYVAAHDDNRPALGGGGRPYVHAEDYTFDEPLTYYAHVKPVLDANCAGCHIEGQISGNTPLNDPLFVQEIADDIARVVWDRYMPPWMPGPESVPLLNERLLTDEEIALLITWADSGAELGDPSQAQDAAPVTNVPTIRQDYIMQLDTPYLPDDTNTDDYRCFVFYPDLEETAFMTGYVFEPDQAEMVHHGILYRIDKAARQAAFRRDGEGGQPGWSCYNTTQLGGNVEEIIGTWTPGTFPVFYADNTGYRIEPGDLLVMQIHYNTSITHVPDQTRVVVQFAEEGEEIRPLMSVDLLAPVEIPCPAGVEGEQCTREYAVSYTAERYGLEFSRRPDGLLRNCRKTLSDFEGMDASNATSSCDYPIRWPLTATGLLGHMHELGKSIRIELNPDTPEAVVLLDIPRWDFHWQDRYQFAEPVQVRPGDVVRMTCVWDNTLSENPRYIVWGEGTEDEMCFATITVLDPRP